VVDWVPEDSLPGDAEGRVVCGRCGAWMKPWSPIEGAIWWECDCGEAVLALADVPQPVEEEIEW